MRAFVAIACLAALLASASGAPCSVVYRENVTCAVPAVAVADIVVTTAARLASDCGAPLNGMANFYAIGNPALGGLDAGAPLACLFFAGAADCAEPGPGSLGTVACMQPPKKHAPPPPHRKVSGAAHPSG